MDPDIDQISDWPGTVTCIFEGLLDSTTDRPESVLMRPRSLILWNPPSGAESVAIQNALIEVALEEPQIGVDERQGTMRVISQVGGKTSSTAWSKVREKKWDAVGGVTMWSLSKV